MDHFEIWLFNGDGVECAAQDASEFALVMKMKKHPVRAVEHSLCWEKHWATMTTGNLP